MSKYFYTDGSESFGPFTLEELKEKGITRQTNVWFEELKEWKKAGTVEELNQLFTSIPPSVQQQKNYNQNSNPQINSYSKTDIILFISIAFWFVTTIIEFSIQQLVLDWYFAPTRYIIMGFNLTSAVIPITLAISVKDKRLRTVAIILSILLAISKLYSTIIWLID